MLDAERARQIGIEGLLHAARFTDRIWPVPAEAVSPGLRPGMVRGLGAPQPNAKHGYRLGSRVRIIVESTEEKHLLLLNQGADNIIYCLCPSDFAPNTKLNAGQSVLPQPASPYESFLITGQPGRKHLLAFVSDSPLRSDWMPNQAA